MSRSRGRKLRRLLPTLLAGSAAVWIHSGSARDARAQATLVSGLGGPAGYGSACVPACDDCSSPQDSVGLDLTPAFPMGLHFYSGTYMTGWVNNNGNVSFQSPVGAFTPNAFPGAPQPMIAPFWADVDTRTMPSSCATSATCTNPTTNGVWWSLAPGKFIVTWDHVGVFACEDTLAMSFQMILSASQCGATSADGGAAGANFDIEFRYHDCGWEAGSASGGVNGFCAPGTVDAGSCTPAQAGFDSAETPDMDYASLPGSRMSGVAAGLCAGSNLTPPQPGVWRFAVRGGAIMCPTAGQACVTTKLGICAQGALQCGVTGAPACVATTAPRPRQCNGLDNDCDGTIDDGPCPSGTACDGTACVASCLEGGCHAGYTCSAGLCIESDCLNVSCPQGERCVAGHCADPCAGVSCPAGQACRAGACVDPCAGLDCGMGQVCVAGTCKPACPCTVCAASETCQSAGVQAGRCVQTACASLTCPAGRVCNAGACVDACAGAVCPAGQTCKAGTCAAAPVVDAGADASYTLVFPEAGLVRDSGDQAGLAEGGPDADAGADAAAEAAPGQDVVARARGCGCIEARGGDAAWGSALVAALAAARWRRRRRGSR